MRAFSRLIAAALLLAGAVFAHTAAASSFGSICTSSTLPVQPGTEWVNPGLLWNPARSGTGWSIVYSEGMGGGGSGVHLVWYTYRSDGSPIWYLTEPVTIGTDAAGNGSFQTALYTYRWERPGNNAVPYAVRDALPAGHIRGYFSPNDQSRVAVEWRLAELGATYTPECLTDFSRELHPASLAGRSVLESMTSGVNMAFNGAYYDPLNSGWGMFQHVVRTNNLADESLYKETLALALYDDDGHPTWVLGEAPGDATSDPPPLGTWAQIPLTLYFAPSAFNPQNPCAGYPPKCYSEEHQVGTWRRSFENTENVRASLEVEFNHRGVSLHQFDIGQPPLPNQTEPAASVTLRRLTRNNYIVVDRAPCVAYPGQATCNISINWSAAPGSNPVEVWRVESGPGGPSEHREGTGENGEKDIALDPLVYGINGPRFLHFELRTSNVVVSRTPVLYAVATTSDPLATVAQAPYPGTEAQAAHTAGLTRLPASAGVSGGAATYSIPIEVPPGRRGMQPSVSLEYSSRSGNGIAGMGFSLSAGGSVHRCPATLEQDGYIRAVTLANDDPLCLNGQRLRRISGGAHGNAGAVYATEIDSFVRVTQQGGDLASTNTYFEVRTKEGETHIYGAPQQFAGAGALVQPETLNVMAQALAPLHWMLAERQDQLGNVERHIYATSAVSQTGATVREVLLKEIRYTGHRNNGALSEGTRRVAFVHEPRADHSSSFVGGGVLWQTQRLARIETYAPAEARHDSQVHLIKKYELSYSEHGATRRGPDHPVLPPVGVDSPSLSSGRSLLRYVTESSSNAGATVARAPTVFEWQDGELDVEQTLLSTVAPALPKHLHPVRTIGDFNGDGHRELLATTADQRYVLVSLGADRELLWTVDISRAFANSANATASILYPFFHDVDLDGRVDLQVIEFVDPTVTPEPGTTRPPLQQEVVYYRLAESGSAAPGFDEVFPASRRIRTGFPTTELHDLNGDGYPDLVSTSVDGDPTCPGSGKRVSFVLNRFGSNPQLDPDAPGVDPFGAASGAGADGSFCLQGSSVPSDQQTVAAVLDLNGDGLLDFALSALPGTQPPERRNLWAQVRLAQPLQGGYRIGGAQSFSAFLGEGASTSVWAERPEGGGLLTGDFNGDGLVDLAWPARKSPTAGLTWAFRFGTGKGFGRLLHSSYTQGLVYALTDGGAPTYFLHSGRLRVADTNADGRDEILFPSAFAHHVCTRNLREGGSATPIALNSGQIPPSTQGNCAAESNFLPPLLQHPDAPQASCIARPAEHFLRIPQTVEEGQFYYECPEDPLTGHPTHRPESGQLGVVMLDAPEGQMQFPVVGTYSTGVGSHDMSVYRYTAFSVRLSTTGEDIEGEEQAVGLQTHQYVSSFGEDLFSDGLIDSIYATGAGACMDGDWGCAMSRMSPSNRNPAHGVATRIEMFDMKPLVRISESRGVGSAVFGRTPTLPDLLAAVVEPVAGTMGDANIFEWRYSPLSGRAGRAAGSLPLYTLQPPPGDTGSYADDRHFYFTSSMPVVAEFSRPAGVRNAEGAYLQNTTLYGYGQAMYHAFGRGFQGFRSIEEWDLTQGSALQTVFHQRFPLTSRIERQTVRALDVSGSTPVLRGPLSTTQNTWLCGRSDRSACPDNGGNWSGGFPFLDRSVVETFDASAAQAGNAAGAISRKTVSHAPWGTLTADACPSLAEGSAAAGYDEHGNLLYKHEEVEDLGSTARLSKACSLERHEYLPANTNPAVWWVNRLDKTTQHRRISYSAPHAVPPSVPAGDLNPRQSRRSVYLWDNVNRLLNQQTEQLVLDAGTDTLSTSLFRYPVPQSTANCAGAASVVGTNYGLPTCVSVTRGATTAGDAPHVGIDLALASPETRETRTAYSADGYFPAEVRNALGHTVSTVSRPRDGQPASATDANGLRTEIQYDAFGFAVRTRFPQRSGTLTRQPDIAVGLQACGSAGVDCSGIPGAQYRQQTLALGAPTRMQYFDVLGREIASEVEVRAESGAIQGTRISRTGVFHNRRGLIEREAAPVGVNTFGAVVSGWPAAYTEYSGFDVLGRPALKREIGMDRASVTPTSTNLSDRSAAPDRATAYTYSGRSTSIRAFLVSGNTEIDERMLSRELDGLGRHLLTVDATDTASPSSSGGTTRYWFDAWGQPVAAEDARGAITRASHDAAGRRHATHDPNQGRTTYRYSGFGELLRQVDARGVQQTFRYDALGRQTQREVPAKGACNLHSSPMLTASELGTRCNIATVDRFFYDGVVDAQGTVGSAEARGLPSGHQRDFVHGAAPNLVTTRTERGVADYFDTHGRLIERRTRQDVSQPVLANLGPDSGQRRYSHRWAYDTRFGRVLAESWPNGVGRSFVYSSIGAVEAELGLGDAMPLTLREVREVNALGQATEEWLGHPDQHGALRIRRTQTLATGEMESIQYARRAMGGATPATIWHETYRYDGWGNLIRRAQSQPDLPAEGGSFSQFERYQYDALHRLTQSTLTTNGASAPAVGLAYDKVGNLLKKTDFSRDLANAYSYPAANGVQPNAVQSVALASDSSNTQHYRYDASGNVVCQFLLNNTVRSCTDLDAFRAYYNHNQQPVYQRRTLAHSVNGSLYSDAWFTYGADQQPARQWGFEGTPDCINQPADRGCLRHHRIYLDRYEDTVGSFRHFDGGERLYRSRAYVGDYLIATRGRYGELELSFLLRDRLGSVVGVEGVTLEQRNIKILRAETRHSFDAYGTPRSNFKRDGSLWTEQPRWTSPTRTQQGFTGHERLSGLQLIHMRGRVFDPQLGRFHGVDPIIQFPLSSQGLNPYSYILNNPLAGVDPTGYACAAPTGSRIKNCGKVDELVSAANTIVSTARSYGVLATSCGNAVCSSRNNNGADANQGSHGVLREDGAPGGVAENGPAPSSSARWTGAGRVVFGGVEVAVAVYACAQTVGIGCFAGAGILATLGADQIYTGATEVWTGVPRESQTVQLFQAAGASLGTARMLEFGINLGAGGVISAPYVGWRARSALTSGGAASSAVPEGYIRPDVIVDMRGAPLGSGVNAAGYPRNGPWFWRQLQSQQPELFDASNMARIRAGRSPEVNEAWVAHYPQHQAFLGQKLVHHHIQQGPIATPLPEIVHQSWYRALHPNR